MDENDMLVLETVMKFFGEQLKGIRDDIDEIKNNMEILRNDVTNSLVTSSKYDSKTEHIFDKFEEIDTLFEDLNSRLSKIEDKIETNNEFRWKLIGALIAFEFIISIILTYIFQK